MMIYENVAFFSVNTVNRMLKKAGVLDSKDRKPSSKGKGFDHASKPHTQRHIYVSYINAGGISYFLCPILNGYSRFIFGWDLAESMKEGTYK